MCQRSAIYVQPLQHMGCFEETLNMKGYVSVQEMILECSKTYFADISEPAVLRE